MHLSLRSKTIIGVATIELVLLVFLIKTALDFMENSVNQGLIKRAETASKLLASATKDAVLSYDLASLESHVQEMLQNPDITYARIVNDEGELYAQAGQPRWLQRTFQADIEVKQVEDGVFDVTAPIAEASDVYGHVEIGISVSELQQAIGRVQRLISSIAAIEMLLVALFSFALGNYLTAQLYHLRKATRKASAAVKTGEYENIEVPIKGNDELSEVSHAFNGLFSTLQTEHDKRTQYERRLEELNQNLEAKVQARTALLAQQNDQLTRTNIELKTTQNQLLQAEKMASVGQLAAGVAHEINNPVGFVASNLSTLKDYAETYLQLHQIAVALHDCDSDDPRALAQQKQALRELMQEQDLAFINEDIESLLAESKDGLDRVKAIVNGLLDFSRADNQDMQTCDINQCIKTTLAMVRGQLKYHCDIRTEFATLPKVQCNAGKINQVLTNLLINAGQAVTEQGVISVKTQVHQQQIHIYVADNGCGIPQANVKRLFDPFFTTKPEGEGTGLGLAISYGIMQEHGGDINVKSVMGKGTCFILTLPINAQQNDQPVELGDCHEPA